ncbi:pyrroline-5-carboxylate reductase dimerization domain-containing protein [Mesorhizobium sp. KR2-14]|uniref:pyrroline-5-carboxylate reductase family protein n=1 Tax=Mesorhizobium sp. KR2-14 TaxID=3156610 RepID=UPI0032B3DE1E
MSHPTIGIIGGTGWLGRSMALAMLDTGSTHPSRLILSSRAPNAGGLAGWSKVEIIADNRELAARADMVILSVRPEQFRAVEIDAAGKLLISVMAGVSMATLASTTGADRIVRAMPNAGAEIRRSYTPWFASHAVSAAERKLVQQLFETCGMADELSCEAEIDYLTGLSGSGPAFPALLAHAMLGHALERGLPEDVAKRAVEAVITGASQLLAGQNICPEETVRVFLDYQGTTAAGLKGMIDGGFVEAVRAGLDAAESAAVAMSRVQ